VKQQARAAQVETIPITQLPAMRRFVAKLGKITITKVFKDDPRAPADHPAMMTGNSRILDDNIILPGAADASLTFGQYKQPLPGSLNR
tara:strand:- start:1446 stop:1709 length:264 start_codon:yes stop_codon:yes gene_type:complete